MLKAGIAQQNLRVERIKGAAEKSDPRDARELSGKKEGRNAGSKHAQKTQHLPCRRVSHDQREQIAQRQRNNDQEILRGRGPLHEVRRPPVDASAGKHVAQLGVESPGVTVELFLGGHLAQPPKTQDCNINSEEKKQGEKRFINFLQIFRHGQIV